MTAAPIAGATRTDLPEQLHLRAPMPGLAGYDEFTVTALDDTGVLFALRSEPAGARPVRLFVVDPDAFFPDYHPAIDATAVAALGSDAAGAHRLLRLVVVRPSADGEPPTANLLAPLLVDPDSGAAVQTVLAEDWPLRAPLGHAA